MLPDTSPATSGVNLLPPDALVRQRARRLRVRLGGALAGTAVLVAAAAGIAWGQARGEQEDLDRARAERDGLQAASQGYGEVTRLATDIELTEGQLGTAMGSEVRWSRYLADLSGTFSDNAWLLYLGGSVDEPGPASPAQPSGRDPAGAFPVAGDGVGQVRFTGRALSHDDVAALLSALSRQRGTAAPYLIDSVAGKDEGGRDIVEFNAYATLRPEILSRRYVRRAGG